MLNFLNKCAWNFLIMIPKLSEPRIQIPTKLILCPVIREIQKCGISFLKVCEFLDQLLDFIEFYPFF